MYGTSYHINTKPIRFASTDHYGKLNLNRNATNREIKSAYYKLSKQLHPDVNNDANAETKFKEIQEAYHILSDQERKETYDRSIDENLNQTYQYPNINKNYYHSKWKNKTGKVYTGRTNKYDFDEYYRMHYEYMVKKRQQEIQQDENIRQKWDEYKKQQAEENLNYEFVRKRTRRSVWIWLLFFQILLYAFIKRLQENEKKMEFLRSKSAK